MQDTVVICFFYQQLPWQIGNGAPLYLSPSPSYPCIEGEAMCVNPMVREQQETETSIQEASPSPDVAAATRTSEIKYNQKFGGKYDVETGRSKTQMWMIEEPSNSLCGQLVANTGLVAPNLEHSLGQGEASVHVSSLRKIQSSSVSSSNFDGYGKGQSKIIRGGRAKKFFLALT